MPEEVPQVSIGDSLRALAALADTVAPWAQESMARSLRWVSVVAHPDCTVDDIVDLVRVAAPCEMSRKATHLQQTLYRRCGSIEVQVLIPSTLVGRTVTAGAELVFAVDAPVAEALEAALKAAV